MSSAYVISSGYDYFIKCFFESSDIVPWKLTIQLETINNRISKESFHRN